MRTRIVSDRDGYRTWEITGSYQEADRVFLRVVAMREAYYVTHTRGERSGREVVAWVRTRHPHLRPAGNGHRPARPALPARRVRYSLHPRIVLVGAGVLAVLTAAGAAVWSIVTATRAAVSWSTANYELIVGALFCLALASIAIKATLR